MLALSVREPWAKDVENRSWYTDVRGPVYIHAFKTFDMNGYRWIRNELGLSLPAIKNFKLGGIIESVNLIDCVKEYNSRWFFGEYGFVFQDPQLCDFRRCRGQLGFFEVDKEMRE